MDKMDNPSLRIKSKGDCLLCFKFNSINILERDSSYLFYFKQLIFILFQYQLIFESFFSISLFYISNLVDQSINQS